MRLAWLTLKPPNNLSVCLIKAGNLNTYLQVCHITVCNILRRKSQKEHILVYVGTPYLKTILYL